MRVLFCSTGGLGHLLPMRPLAQALQARGAAVAWVTAPDAAEWVRSACVRVYPAGSTFGDSRRRFACRQPVPATLQEEARSEFIFARLFGDTLAPDMLTGVLAAIDDWRPERLVFEPAALAAPLACRLRGIAGVVHAYGLPLPASLLAEARDWMAPLWASTGGGAVPEDAGVYASAAIEVVPTSVQPGSLAPWSMRLNPHACPPPSDAVAARPGPPRLYLSFGTVFNTSPVLVRAAQALLDLGARVVLTAGSDEAARRFPLRHERLSVLAFAAQAGLFEQCDAVICHGGAGTVLGAAARGLPQLLLPQGADHFRYARAMQATGAARMLLPSDQGRDEISLAAQALLGTPRHRAAAQALARDIRDLPGPEEVAAALSPGLSGN